LEAEFHYLPISFAGGHMFHSPAEKTYRYRAVLRYWPWAPILIGGVVCYLVYNGSNLKTLGWIAGGCAILSLIWWKATASPRLEFHREGIDYTGVFGEKTIPWDEITETRYHHQLMAQALGWHFGLVGALIAARAAKRPDAKKASQTLAVVSPNAKLTIASSFENFDEILDIIFSKVNPRIKAAAQKAIAGGGTASFGKIQLSSAGVIWKNKEPIPYSRISSAGIEGQSFRIKAEGKWLALVSIRSQKVPNIFVLTELIQEMKSPASVTKPESMGGARFGV